MVRFVILLVAIFVAPCCAEPPRLFTEETFSCATLAEAANHFIALGEEAAVKELESLTVDETELGDRTFSVNERIGWICRIVFTSKGDRPLRQPGFGVLLLPTLSMPDESWPQYPIALSRSTHFVLSEGNSFAGNPESTSAYLVYCRENGIVREEPVIVPTRRQALQDLDTLRLSDRWKSIKWSDRAQGVHYDLSEAWKLEFLRGQAMAIVDE